MRESESESVTRKESVARVMMKVLQDAGWHVGDSPEYLDDLVRAWEAGTRADNDFMSNRSDGEFYKDVRVLVRVGQVWEDNDRRQRANPRRGKILRVMGGFATVKWDTGRTTEVALKRFRPNSTGYRLVEDADASATQAVGTLATWTNPLRKG